MAYNGASSFGSNDSGYESGIVEVFDEPPRPVLNSKDLERDLARQRQNILAAELSRRDAEEYQHDILEHMLQMDVSSPWPLATSRTS
jgi:hypothetical protein